MRYKAYSFLFMCILLVGMGHKVQASDVTKQLVANECRYNHLSVQVKAANGQVASTVSIVFDPYSYKKFKLALNRLNGQVKKLPTYSDRALLGFNFVLYEKGLSPVANSWWYNVKKSKKPKLRKMFHQYRTAPKHVPAAGPLLGFTPTESPSSSLSASSLASSSSLGRAALANAAVLAGTTAWASSATPTSATSSSSSSLSSLSSSSSASSLAPRSSISTAAAVSAAAPTSAAYYSVPAAGPIFCS